MDTQIATTLSGQLHAISTVWSEADAERFALTMQRQGYQVARLSQVQAALRFKRPARSLVSRDVVKADSAQPMGGTAWSLTLPSKSAPLPWLALAGLPVTLAEVDYGGEGTGQFDLWPWHLVAEELARRVSARRSLAAALLFGRELNDSAQHWVANHQQWLKVQAEVAAYAEREARDVTYKIPSPPSQSHAPADWVQPELW